MIEIQIPPAMGLKMAMGPLEAAARAALRQQAAPETAGLSIVLGDDDSLQRLNREYLGLDHPTDVLSFPAGEVDPETGAPYLGDVIISVPRAEAQAERGGHPLIAELQLLVIHGVLHLLGHDHAEPLEKSRMWAAQAEILATLGLAGLTIPE